MIYIFSWIKNNNKAYNLLYRIPGHKGLPIVRVNLSKKYHINKNRVGN